MLTSVHSRCFQFEQIIRPKQSPFKKISALSKLVSVVNPCFRPAAVNVKSSEEDESTSDREDSNVVDGTTSDQEDKSKDMDDGVSDDVLEEEGSTPGGEVSDMMDHSTSDQEQENKDMDDGVLDEGCENPASFYQFGYLQFCDLFPLEDYGDSIAVLPSIEEATMAGIENTRVLLVVDSIPPQDGTHTVRHRHFDLQVACILRARKKGLILPRTKQSDT